jgi:hypothetical protein
MVLESMLLDDCDVTTATAPREQEPDWRAAEEQVGWPQPGAAHRADWRRHRAAIEQGFELHTPWGVRPPRRLRLLAGALDLARHSLAATGLLPVMSRRALRIRRTEIDLTFPHLPAAFEGYRILQIADPHFDAMDGIAEAIRAAAAGVQVDLCVFTGDYRAAETGAFRERERGFLGPMARIVEQIAAPDGCLAILGNHDTHEMLEPLEDVVGVRVLANERVEIRRDGQAIELLGLDDPYRFYSASTRRFVETLAGAPDRFRIMLVHTPDFAQQAAELGGALYLCGHTHGGQICLPGGRPIVQHLHKETGLGRGLWRRGAMVGYTSRGAGLAGSLPMRLFAPAEITLFRLRRAAA